MRLVPGALALALLAGCSLPTPPKAAPTEAPIEPARAKAVAQAALLRPADLPGWRATKPDPDSPADKAMQQRIRECTKRPAVRAAATDERAYARGVDRLSSSVEVTPRTTNAQDDLADARNKAVVDCLAELIGDGVEAPPGGKVTVTAAHVAIKVPGSDGVACLRFTIRATGRGGSAAGAVYIALVIVGNTEITLTSARTDIGPPVPPARLATLLALLAARVRDA